MRPTAMPSGTPTTRPATASNVDCHAIAPRVWRRVNPIDAQHREVAAPPAHGRDQRVRDGRAREQREEHAEREREVLDAGEVGDRGGERRGLREEVAPADAVTQLLGRGDVGAGAPPHQQVVLAVVARRARPRRRPAAVIHPLWS